jgi:hypothetical protein
MIELLTPSIGKIEFIPSERGIYVIDVNDDYHTSLKGFPIKLNAFKNNFIYVANSTYLKTIKIGDNTRFSISMNQSTQPILVRITSNLKPF